MNKDIKWFELSGCFIFAQGFPWQSSFPQPRGARAVGECSRPPPENAGMVQQCFLFVKNPKEIRLVCIFSLL